MHPSSILNMKKAVGLIDLDRNLTILDVGGRDIGQQDRSYRSIFADRSKHYFTADIASGKGVTHVMPGPYELPFSDNNFDLVVSGQTLEHVYNPFRLVQEMTRVLKPDGTVIIIVPSAGPRHDNPDCWRFMDDSFVGIAKECNLQTLHDWVDRTPYEDRSKQWADHVFIGKKQLQ